MLCRSRKRIIATTVAIAIALTAILVRTIAPFNAELRHILENTDKDCTSLPEQVRQLAVVAEGESGMTTFSSQVMLDRVSAGADGQFRRFWPVTHLLWNAWLRMAFSANERSTIWCQIAGGGQFASLAAFSRDVFSRPLLELSAAESAKLIVLRRSPSYFRDNPEALELQAKALLSKYLDLKTHAIER